MRCCCVFLKLSHRGANLTGLPICQSRKAGGEIFDRDAGPGPRPHEQARLDGYPGDHSTSSRFEFTWLRSEPWTVTAFRPSPRVGDSQRQRTPPGARSASFNSFASCGIPCRTSDCLEESPGRRRSGCRPRQGAGHSLSSSLHPPQVVLRTNPGPADFTDGTHGPSSIERARVDHRTRSNPRDRRRRLAHTVIEPVISGAAAGDGRRSVALRPRKHVKGSRRKSGLTPVRGKTKCLHRYAV
jgi:hypothetical protein